MFTRFEPEDSKEVSEMIIRKVILPMMVFAIASMYACFAFAAEETAPGTANGQNQASTLLMKSADFLSQAKQLSVNPLCQYN